MFPLSQSKLKAQAMHEEKEVTTTSCLFGIGNLAGGLGKLLKAIVLADFEAAKALLHLAMTAPRPPTKHKVAAGCLRESKRCLIVDACHFTVINLLGPGGTRKSPVYVSFWIETRLQNKSENPSPKGKPSNVVEGHVNELEPPK